MQSDRNGPTKLILRVVISCAALLLFQSNSSASTQQSGPTNLIITYRCVPANRAAFRASIAMNEIPRFERWKRTGMLEDYRLFFNVYVDENTWDLMALLSFRQYADVARWREIERTWPGGLSRESLRLGGPVMTYSVDLAWRGGAPDDHSNTGKSVFLIIPYEVVNLEEYKPYVSGYVIPQIDGWMTAGVLQSYGLYLNRYYAGKPWESLLVLEYKDMESFGQRENVMAKVRAALAADPKWKALSENKKNIRTEKESVLAEELSRR